MKKILSALICLGLLNLSACTKETTITRSTDTTTTTSNVESSTEEELAEVIDVVKDIEVDENLMSVTVTLPAEIVGETSQDELDKKVKETEGYFSATLNDDGSVTYVMTKAKHQEVIDATAAGFDETLQSIVDSEDYSRVVSITHNDEFTEFTVEYDADEVKGFDYFICLTMFTCGGMYGVVTGEKPENVYVTFVNSETGEVIFESNYVAYMKNLESRSEETSSIEE